MLGKEFHPGAIVCVTPPNDLRYPTFDEVICIFVPEHIKQLLICLYETEDYSSQYNAYHIVDNSVQCRFLNQLCIHEVFHKYSVSSKFYVTIKSYHHVEHDI